MYKLLAIALLFGGLSGCQSTPDTTLENQTSFEKTFLNQKNGYSESVAVDAGGIKTIYVSGQIGDGDDFETQMRNALANLEKALQAAGATYKDLVKINTYIVDYEPAQLDIFRNVRKEIMGDEKMPASTLVGVSALALPEWKIEIDAVAVIGK